MEMRSNSDEIITEKAYTFKKVLRPLALLAASPPKMPAPHADSTVYFYKRFGNKNYCKFYSKQYPPPAIFAR